MFKRVTWFVAGAVTGAGGSVYARRKAKEAAEKYRPVAIARNTAVRVRGRASDVVDAVRDGRVAMREREAELRAELDNSHPSAGPQLRIVRGERIDDIDEAAEALAEPGRRGRAGPRRRARR